MSQTVASWMTSEVLTVTPATPDYGSNPAFNRS